MNYSAVTKPSFFLRGVGSGNKTRNLEIFVFQWQTFRNDINLICNFPWSAMTTIAYIGLSELFGSLTLSPLGGGVWGEA